MTATTVFCALVALARLQSDEPLLSNCTLFPRNVGGVDGNAAPQEANGPHCVTRAPGFSVLLRSAATSCTTSTGGGGGGGGGGAVAACARASGSAAAICANAIATLTGVDAVLNVEETAASAAAEAGGMPAKSSVIADALKACAAASGFPSIVTDLMPELRTPLAEIISLYGPQRTPKFCTSAVTLSGWCGSSVSERAL